jgi:HSP20 family protein
MSDAAKNIVSTAFLLLCARGEFTRSFTLPGFVDTNKVNAEFKDGILRVTLAKREEAKPKQVEVKVK